MTPHSSPATLHSDPPAPVAGQVAPDAQRLQAQLAAQAEAGPLDPLLQLLRLLLAARTVAWLPAGAGEIVVGAAAAELGKLRGVLDPAKAMILPAPALGADGYTLAVPVGQEGRALGWLVAQLPVVRAGDLPAFVVLLQTFAGYLLYREQRHAMSALHGVLERTSGVLDLFRRVGSELDFDQACRLALDAL